MDLRSLLPCALKTYGNYIVISPGNCTFDEGLCKWINDPNDDFDWQLIEGGTPSEETGPTAGYEGEG